MDSLTLNKAKELLVNLEKIESNQEHLFDEYKLQLKDFLSQLINHLDEILIVQSSSDDYRDHKGQEDDVIFEKKKLEKELKNAIKNNQLFIVYQPKIDLNRNEIIGVEALLRWQHPERGLISPAVFIPIAEEAGFIYDLTIFVFEEACKQCQLWHDKGISSIIVSVNISAKDIIQPNFVEQISVIYKKYQIAPNYLELEITENSIMVQSNETLQTINDIKKLGIYVSIDDFGTGYSSLSYLKQFDVDTLKIDQSFINNLMNSKGDQAIVSAIISIAQNLGMNVIAEGVEKKEVAIYLMNQGCYQVQGYYYSKPLREEDFLEYYRTFDQFVEKFMQKYEVEITSRNIRYSEGLNRLNLRIEPFVKNISYVFIPQLEKWNQTYPWAKNRRDEIIRKIKSKLGNLDQYRFQEF